MNDVKTDTCLDEVLKKQKHLGELADTGLALINQIKETKDMILKSSGSLVVELNIKLKIMEDELREIARAIW